jgi:hypothetical protein
MEFKAQDMMIIMIMEVKINFFLIKFLKVIKV